MQIPLDTEYAEGLITPHPTWNVIDASKMEDFRRCPRRFFWMYVLGWCPEGPKSYHLVVGKSLHKAMEVICNKRIPEDAEGIMALLKEASGEYEKELRKVFPPEMDGSMKAKAFGNVISCISQYLTEHTGEELNVIHTEVAGTVPIGGDRWMHFLLDLVVRDKDQGITVWDHKTGSRMSDLWISQFYLRPQLALYTHALYCLYEPDEVFGALVNGFIFRMRKNALIRIPIRYTPEQIEAFLWDINRQLDYLEADFADLQEARDEDECLMAFPRNDQGCTKYGSKCAYHDFCVAWPNPLKRVRNIPAGFERRFWDPRESEEGAKEVWNLRKQEEQYSMDEGDPQ